MNMTRSDIVPPIPFDLYSGDVTNRLISTRLFSLLRKIDLRFGQRVAESYNSISKSGFSSVRNVKRMAVMSSFVIVEFEEETGGEGEGAAKVPIHMALFFSNLSVTYLVPFCCLNLKPA